MMTEANALISDHLSHKVIAEQVLGKTVSILSISKEVMT